MKKNNSLIKSIKENRIRFIITALHIVLSFVFSKFVYKNIGIIAIGTKPVNDTIGQRAESALAYILSEFFAILFIYLFWKLVFHIFKHFRRSYIVFIAIFVIGLLLLMLSWPDVFVRSNDNLLTYSSAVRLTPDYWHCAYSGYIYAGMLLFFPADFSITIIQWLFFVFMIGYLYERTGSVAPKLKILVFLLFALPNTLLIIMDSYRICQFVIIACFYETLIFLDIIERKVPSLKRYALVALLGSFLSIWRSEAIIFGILFYLIYIVFTGQKSGAGKSFGKKLFPILIFAICFILIMIPQKIGEKKYYGKDYHIINSMYPLNAFLNSDLTELEYEGADKDLEAIDKVVPISAIKRYGMDGYRRYNNSVKGNTDINQSCVSDEEASAYMKAYLNILIHNPKQTLRLIWDNIMYSFSARHIWFRYKAPEDDPSTELGEWGSYMWDNAGGDFYSNGHTAKISAITSKIGLGEKLVGFQMKYSSLLYGKRFYLISFFALCAGNLWLFIFGVISSVRKRANSRLYLGIGLAGLTLLGQYLAILLVMPAPSYVYFIITDYLSLFLIFFAVCNAFRIRRIRKNNN